MIWRTHPDHPDHFDRLDDHPDLAKAIRGFVTYAQVFLGTYDCSSVAFGRGRAPTYAVAPREVPAFLND